MALAGRAPHRAPILSAIGWWSEQLSSLGVALELNATISPEAPPRADRVIWAIGSVPAQSAVWRRRPHLISGIPGTDLLPHGRNVLAGTAKARGRVLIVDEENGWPTISLAETLIGTPDVDAVMIVTAVAHPALPDLLFTVEISEVAVRLNAAGIGIVPGETVAAVDAGTATLSSGRTLGPFDTIVLSTGTLPRPIPESALAIGDCAAPRGFWAATDDAARCVDSL